MVGVLAKLDRPPPTATAGQSSPCSPGCSRLRAPCSRSPAGRGSTWCSSRTRYPALRFVPSDPDPSARDSIEAHRAEAGLANVEAALALDVRETPWPITTCDAVVAINMVHISPWEATLALLDGAAARLPAGGPLVLYGPYRVDGVHTAESNARFDEGLRARDPAWGVRNLEAVLAAAAERGLVESERVAMPADHDLTVVLRRG